MEKSSATKNNENAHKLLQDLDQANLSEYDRRRLTETFVLFTKADKGQKMKMNEFFSMLFEKNMINNRLGFRIYYDNFCDHCHSDDTLELHKFMYLIYVLAKSVLPLEKKPVKALINILITDKITVNLDIIDKMRTPNIDEFLRKLLDKPVVKIFLDYEIELQNIFTAYCLQNLNFTNGIMLNWRENQLQNNTLTATCIARLLRDSEIVPAKISIEYIEDFLLKIAPPTKGKETTFYHNHVLREIYEKEIDRKTPITEIDGEPKLNFPEFMLLLGRIAQETVGQDKSNPETKKAEKKLAHFFQNVMLIRNNDQISGGIKLPELNKRFLNRLEKYYECLNGTPNSLTGSGVFKAPPQSLPKLESPEEHFLEILNSADHTINIEEILKELEKELPELPFPEVKRLDAPPTTTKPKIVIGAQIPKAKERMRARPRPPARNNKEKPIRWAPPPGRQPLSSHEILAKYKDFLYDESDPAMLESEYPVTNKMPLPTLIKECLFNEDFPKGYGIEDELEAVFLYQNEGNFTASLCSLAEAKLKWEQARSLEAKDSMFFEFITGSIYESAGREDLAIKSYLNCKIWAQKLSFNHPDGALAYAGLGSVLYSMYMYRLSARAFLKCKTIRDGVLGDEHPDCASLFNNIGCGLYMTENYREALANFLFAEAIFEATLGPQHQRTMTVKYNLNLARKKPYTQTPQFPQMWVCYYSPFPEEPTKKRRQTINFFFHEDGQKNYQYIQLWYDEQNFLKQLYKFALHVIIMPPSNYFKFFYFNLLLKLIELVEFYSEELFYQNQQFLNKFYKVQILKLVAARFDF